MAFTAETAADEILKAMKEAQKKKEFYFEEAAVIKQDPAGKMVYHETGDMRTGKGAGALIGGILGILGGPACVALGAAAAHGDAGFRDKSLESVGSALKPGTSALAVITSSAFLKAVQEQVSEVEMLESVKSLSEEISRNLEEGKSMALGILLSEDGLAVKEVAVSEDSTEGFGMVVTDEAVIAGAALVTDEGMAYEAGVETAEGMAVESGVITGDEAVIVDAVETEDAPEAEGPDDPPPDET